MPASPAPDVLNYSWLDYGNRVGAWRILELCQSLQLPLTVLVNSRIYQFCPELIAAFREAGCEIAAHGRTNAERQGQLPEAEERKLIAEATVEIAPAMPPASAATRDASDWHTDTFCNGPAWADFAKAMGINEGAGKSAVYIVSVYRAIPGHREQLESVLSTQSPGDPAAGTVLLQHMEGAAWTFAAVARYAGVASGAAGVKSMVGEVRTRISS